MYRRRVAFDTRKPEPDSDRNPTGAILADAMSAAAVAAFRAATKADLDTAVAALRATTKADLDTAIASLKADMLKVAIGIAISVVIANATLTAVLVFGALQLLQP